MYLKAYSGMRYKVSCTNRKQIPPLCQTLCLPLRSIDFFPIEVKYMICKYANIANHRKTTSLDVLSVVFWVTANIGLGKGRLSDLEPRFAT